MADVKFTRQFGVHGHLKQKVEIYNHIYLGDAMVFIGFGLLALQSQNLPWFVGDQSHMPYVVYALTVIVLAGYLLIHPRSNPGKSNWELLLLSLVHTTRFFQSINAFQDYYRVHCPMLDNEMPKNMNHRLPMNVKYLYHSDDDDSGSK